MKPQIFILLSFLCLAAALPLASAQEEAGNMLTDGLSGFVDWASGIGAQASTFVAEQPVATGAITALGAGTGIGALGWKAASTAKNKLQAAYNGLTEKLSGTESQFSSYKAQAETQLASLQSDAQNQILNAQTQAKAATDQLGGLQQKLSDVTQQKASALNQIEEMQKQYNDLNSRYQELRSHMP